MSPVERLILGLFAVTFVTLAGVMVWVLLEIRRIAAEGQKTLTAVRGHLVLLIQEMRQTTEQADGLVQEVREAFEGTSALWVALGDIGRSVQRAQDFVRGKGMWLARLVGERFWSHRHGGMNGNGRESKLAKRRSADD